MVHLGLPARKTAAARVIRPKKPSRSVSIAKIVKKSMEGPVAIENRPIIKTDPIKAATPNIAPPIAPSTPVTVKPVPQAGINPDWLKRLSSGQLAVPETLTSSDIAVARSFDYSTVPPGEFAGGNLENRARIQRLIVSTNDGIVQQEATLARARSRPDLYEPSDITNIEASIVGAREEIKRLQRDLATTYFK